MRGKALFAVLAVVLVLCAGAAHRERPPMLRPVPPVILRPVPAVRPSLATVDVPVRMERYAAYRMPVHGVGDFRFSVTWAPADVALELRVFAPGRQEPVMTAHGRGAIEATIASAVLLQPDVNGSGDWLIELRHVDAPPAPAVLPVAPEPNTGAAQRLQAVRSLARPRPAGGAPVARPMLQRPVLLPATPPVVKPPEASIQGTLTVRWPGMKDGEILDVTARVDSLRRLIAVQRKELAALRDWQTQWGEAAKAEFIARWGDEDLQELRDSIEAVEQALNALQRNRRQEYETMFEDFDEKTEQLMNTLSSVLKSMNEMRSSIARNML